MDQLRTSGMSCTGCGSSILGEAVLKMRREVCHTILPVLDVGKISKSAAIEQPERLPHWRGQRSEGGHGTRARYRRLILQIC